MKGSFDADAAFLAFIGACDQKPMEAELLGTLIGDLCAKAGVLAGDGPVKIFFPGIGEGEQAAALAARIDGSTGRRVDIRGMDISPGLAELATTRLAADEHVQSTEIVVGNAFGEAAGWPSGNHVAIASHILYYAPSDRAGVAFVEAAVRSLDTIGVLVLIHEGPAPSAMAALRLRYNSNRTVNAPTLLVERAAQQLGVPVYRVDYTSRLRFPRVARRRITEAVGKDVAADVEEAKKLIEFTFQCGLEELEARRVLEAALDDFYARLNPDSYALEWQMQMQIVASPGLSANRECLSSMEQSVERARAHAPELERRYFG